MRSCHLSILLCAAALAAGPAVADDGGLHDLQARMDAAAKNFQSMTARVTYLNHTDVLDDNSTETGTVTMKKVQAGDVQGRIDFELPDKKTVTIEARRVQIYLPKIKTVQIFDLGKHGEKLDQFIMIGFGTSGKQLATDYTMKVLGNDTVKGPQPVQAIKLELTPNTAEAREYLKKLELWIPVTGDPYPIQEKISQPSGDYRLVNYSGMKINPPLKADALELKLPPGVKTDYPGR